MNEPDPQPIHPDPLYVLSEDTWVLVLTPNGSTISLTADAAERSAERLLRAAAAARVPGDADGFGSLLRH